MVKALCLTLLLPTLLLGGIPDLRRPVTDTAGLLSASDQEAVADRLVRLRSETGVQMAVLLVNTTEGVPIEDYSMQAAEAWRGGEAGRDNGLLLVLAVKDRRMRLEVGYGLEEHLPDGTVRRLLDAQGPRMRARNYRGALLAIVEGVGERLPGNQASAELPQPDTGSGQAPERDALAGVNEIQKLTKELEAASPFESPAAARGTGVEPTPELEEPEPDAVVAPAPARSTVGRNAFLGLVLSALAAVVLLVAALDPLSERLGSTRVMALKGALFVVPPVLLSLLSAASGGVIFLGYAGVLVALLVGVRAFQQGPQSGARTVGSILLGCLAVGIGFALANANPERLSSFLDKTFLAGLMAMIPVSLACFGITAYLAEPSEGDLFTSSGGSHWDDDGSSSHRSRRRSSSSSLFSSSRSSSSFSSRSSSSSGRSWGGGGGSFGGGGASSSW
jgi:uncharacterized protein